MSLVHNERTKLRATYLNGLAIALFAVGALAPLFTAASAPVRGPIPHWATAVASLVCLAISVTLHLRGMRALTRLRE